jgi:hypothetical protein
MKIDLLLSRGGGSKSLKLLYSIMNLNTISLPYSSKANKGVCHTLALPFTLKRYVNAKEELWKLKYFTIQKIYLIFKKNPLKETKILQDIS